MFAFSTRWSQLVGALVDVVFSAATGTATGNLGGGVSLDFGSGSRYSSSSTSIGLGGGHTRTNPGVSIDVVDAALGYGVGSSHTHSHSRVTYSYSTGNHHSHSHGHSHSHTTQKTGRVGWTDDDDDFAGSTFAARDRVRNPPSGRNLGATKEEILGYLKEQPENKVCADCETELTDDGRFFSIDHGVFLCQTCAKCHKHLGLSTARVGEFDVDNTKIFEVNGNRANGQLEGSLTAANRSLIKPGELSAESARKQFIRRKYIQKEFFSAAAEDRKTAQVTTKKKSTGPQSKDREQDISAAASAISSNNTRAQRARSSDLVNNAPVAAPASGRPLSKRQQLAAQNQGRAVPPASQPVAHRTHRSQPSVSKQIEGAPAVQQSVADDDDWNPFGQNQDMNRKPQVEGADDAEADQQEAGDDFEADFEANFPQQSRAAAAAAPAADDDFDAHFNRLAVTQQSRPVVQSPSMAPQREAVAAASDNWADFSQVNFGTPGKDAKPAMAALDAFALPPASQPASSQATASDALAALWGAPADASPAQSQPPAQQLNRNDPYANFQSNVAARHQQQQQQIPRAAPASNAYGGANVGLGMGALGMNMNVNMGVNSNMNVNAGMGQNVNNPFFGAHTRTPSSAAGAFAGFFDNGLGGGVSAPPTNNLPVLPPLSSAPSQRGGINMAQFDSSAGGFGDMMQHQQHAHHGHHGAGAHHGHGHHGHQRHPTAGAAAGIDLAQLNSSKPLSAQLAQPAVPQSQGGRPAGMRPLTLDTQTAPDEPSPQRGKNPFAGIDGIAATSPRAHAPHPQSPFADPMAMAAQPQPSLELGGMFDMGMAAGHAGAPAVYNPYALAQAQVHSAQAHAHAQAAAVAAAAAGMPMAPISPLHAHMAAGMAAPFGFADPSNPFGMPSQPVQQQPQSQANATRQQRTSSVEASLPSSADVLDFFQKAKSTAPPPSQTNNKNSKPADPFAQLIPM